MRKNICGKLIQRTEDGRLVVIISITITSLAALFLSNQSISWKTFLQLLYR